MASQRRSRHGIYRAMVAVKLTGLNAIDRRTNAARELLQWREGLIASLGGAEEISVQRMTLVNSATRTKALLDHTDSYLLSLSTIINRRAKSHFPIIAQRERLADSLTRILTTLGLDRVPKPVEDLKTYLDRKEREDAEREANAVDTSNAGEDGVPEPEALPLEPQGEPE
jgi:hypothetical protein